MMQVSYQSIMLMVLLGAPAWLNAQQTYNLNVHEIESWQYGGQAYSEHMEELRARYGDWDRAQQAADSQKKLNDLQAQKIELENEKIRLENEKLKKEINSLNPDKDSLKTTLQSNSTEILDSHPASQILPPSGFKTYNSAYTFQQPKRTYDYLGADLLQYLANKERHNIDTDWGLNGIRDQLDTMSPLDVRQLLKKWFLHDGMSLNDARECAENLISYKNVDWKSKLANHSN